MANKYTFYGMDLCCLIMDLNSKQINIEYYNTSNEDAISTSQVFSFKDISKIKFSIGNENANPFVDIEFNCNTSETSKNVETIHFILKHKDDLPKFKEAFGKLKNNLEENMSETDCANESFNETNNQYYSSSIEKSNPNMYVDIVKHILLLVFTLGIYHCIWIYKITEYTNQIKRNEQRNSVANLLLCLFVPFYVIYWYYKSAEIFYENFDNCDNDFKMIVIIFSIFAPVVSSALMQDKLNKLSANKTDSIDDTGAI